MAGELDVTYTKLNADMLGEPSGILQTIGSEARRLYGPFEPFANIRATLELLAGSTGRSVFYFGVTAPWTVCGPLIDIIGLG